MKSILKRSYVFVAGAALIVSAYFIAGVLIFANNQYYEINTENMKEAARALKSFTSAEIFSDKDASNLRFAAEWASFANISGSYRITFISRNGQVIFDTEADSAVMENHLDRVEFQDAINDGIGTARRRSATWGLGRF